MKALDRPAHLDAGMRRLVEENLGFAYKVALVESSRLSAHGYKMNVDDAIGAALLGLCLAATSFDPGRNVKFITYAVHYVKKEIWAEFDRGRTFHTPSNERRRKDPEAVRTKRHKWARVAASDINRVFR